MLNKLSEQTKDCYAHAEACARKAAAQTDPRLRQDFLDHQLSLIVSALDIFKTWKKETIWDSPGLSQSLLHIRDSRIVYLGLTYRLGTPSKNWKTDEVPADDE